MYVVTPSGLTGEVRKLKGREANTLADRRAARKGETYDRILRSCWTKTDDPGPYEKVGVRPDDPSVPWGKILVCDRFYTLAAIRVATYGPDYIFPVRCGESGAGCGNTFEWKVNIEKDLNVFDLPNESRVKIAAGDNSFSVKLDGRTYVFKLLTGDDERRSGRRLQKSRNALVTTAVASRILKIEGVEKRQDHDAFLEDLDLDIQLELLNLFEEVDGGIDTDFEVECPRCENVFKAAVPFEGEAFWLPRSPKRRSGKSSRKTRRMVTDS